MTLRWHHDLADIDWNSLSELYGIAPLGENSPDGVDCSYIIPNTRGAASAGK
jgi:hypothetical protein